MKNALALVLGGGRGTRLQPLTTYRSKPAVPLAGKYRLIDIPISNCINSGISQIYVLTQFLSVSLHRHIRGTYNFDPFRRGFVEILAAQQTMSSATDWYQGTADAVRKNLRYLKQSDADYVFILSGDQLYRINFRDMLKTHLEAGADVTIATKPVARQEASALGIMRLDESGRVVGFLEKPQSDADIELVRVESGFIEARGIQADGRDLLASMGIYLFDRHTLIAALEKTEYEDFGKEVFPASIRSRHVQAYLFDGYWEDIGTIRSFFDANLALASSDPPFNLPSPDAPIYSRPRYLPPTRIEGASIEHSLIADGCTICEGARVENSVIGLRCRIEKNVLIRNSILMGADEYELEGGQDGAAIPIGIGNDSVVENAIIDKDCRIGPGVKLVAPGGSDRSLGEYCMLRGGVLVVEKSATIPAGWRVEG